MFLPVFSKEKQYTFTHEEQETAAAVGDDSGGAIGTEYAGGRGEGSQYSFIGASSEIDASEDSSSMPKVVRRKMKSKCKVVHRNLLPKNAEIKEQLMVEAAAASVEVNLDTSGLILPIPPATQCRVITKAR